MSAPAQLRTERLLLRRWRPSDFEKFAELNADPVVMEFFPSTLSRDQTQAMVEKMETAFEENDFGLWAVELVATGEFIGFTGLSVPGFEAHFMPCVEIGWRLSVRHWGCGYAPEAAAASVRDGFERVKLTEIVSFTAALNARSIRVMEKLGMTTRAQDNFQHPYLSDGHRLKPHVLYRLSQKDWLAANTGR